MKQWVLDNLVKSVTMIIWYVLIISSTVLLVVGKIDAVAWLTAQPVFAGIALTKRAVTQAIDAGKTAAGPGA